MSEAQNGRCALFAVKKALGKVDGVERVQVDLDKRPAIVVFDDAKTTIQERK